MKQHPAFDKMRIPIRRSNNGAILGVMSGFAERFGWRVWATRALGAIALLSVPGIISNHASGNLYGAGFFYLLLAFLMLPPLPAGMPDPLQTGTGQPHVNDEYSTPGSWVFSRRNGRRFVPTFQRDRESFGQGTTTLPVAPTGRIDLQALDRQLESLNRRIARMEGIVTRREYDWDSRLRRS